MLLQWWLKRRSVSWRESPYIDIVVMGYGFAWIPVLGNALEGKALFSAGTQWISLFFAIFGAFGGVIANRASFGRRNNDA